MLKRSIICVIIFFSTFQTFASENKNLRIISLAPATTEILFALGLDEEIVGVSSFCNYPGKARAKEKVGSFSRPNIEKIIALKPDMIFCTGLEQNIAVAQLRRLKFKVFVSDPVHKAELFESIRQIGILVGKPTQAETLINNMRSAIEEVENEISRIPEYKKPKVFIELWHDPLMTAGKGSYLDELLRLAGGVNIAGDTVRPYSYFSAEQVIKRNPDCIIITYMSGLNPVSDIERRTGWSGISAVKNKRVYNDINPDLLLRPGPRLPDGLKKLYKCLYH